MILSFLQHVAGLSLRLSHQTEAVLLSPPSAEHPVDPAFHWAVVSEHALMDRRHR